MNFRCDDRRPRGSIALKKTALCAGLALAVALGVPAAPRAENDVPLADAEVVRDFMIQDVCLDAAGAVVPGIAPIAGEPRCAGRRDLRPGERLPYHKHDHPSPDQRAGAPQGYQRHDSVPVKTAGLGMVVEHSFDLGSGEGLHFGVFDRGTDGGDIVVLSPGTVSIGATESGGLFGFWVGECRGPVGAASLARSWLIAEFDPNRGPLEGESLARLKGVPAAPQMGCPPHFDSAYTSWHVAPFRYRAAPGQGTPVTLTTLISEHYGGADRTMADHVERFYFTRELGGTRWERWQNIRGNRLADAAKVTEMAAWFAGTGRCSASPPPAGASMVIVDCREWTLIEPPADPAGDRPGFFLDAIRARPDAPAFFAPP